MAALRWRLQVASLRAPEERKECTNFFGDGHWDCCASEACGNAAQFKILLHVVLRIERLLIYDCMRACSGSGIVVENGVERRFGL